MALAEGYQRASLVSAVLSVAAAVVAATVLRRTEKLSTGEWIDDIEFSEVGAPEA